MKGKVITSIFIATLIAICCFFFWPSKQSVEYPCMTLDEAETEFVEIFDSFKMKHDNTVSLYEVQTFCKNDTIISVNEIVKSDSVCYYYNKSSDGEFSYSELEDYWKENDTINLNVKHSLKEAFELVKDYGIELPDTVCVILKRSIDEESLWYYFSDTKIDIVKVNADSLSIITF